MLIAQVNEIVRLYPLGALAKTKCIHLQKLTDSKSKYKKVLRTHRKQIYFYILVETPATKQGCFYYLYEALQNSTMASIPKRIERIERLVPD